MTLPRSALQALLQLNPPCTFVIVIIIIIVNNLILMIMMIIIVIIIVNNLNPSARWAFCLWGPLAICRYTALYPFAQNVIMHICTERNNIFCNSGKGGFGIGSGGGREIFKEQRLWSSSFPCSTIWYIEMYKRIQTHTNHNLVNLN